MTLSIYKNHPYQAEIDNDRFELFIQEVGSRMVATGVFGLLLALYFFEHHVVTETLIWLGCNAFVGIQSWLIIRAYHREAATGYIHIDRWRYLNIYLSILWGVTWASIPWLFFQDAPLIEFFTFLLFMVIISSMPSNSMGCYPEIYIAYVTPLFGSFAVFALTQPTHNIHYLPHIIGIVWLTVTLFSLITHRTQMQSIIQRIELVHTEQKLSAANQQKEHLIAMMGHDLKQPINAARIYLQIADQNQGASYHDALGQILEQLSHNLNQIMSKSAIAADEAFDHLKPIELRALTEGVITPLTTGQTIEVNNEISPFTLHTDPFLLERILDNLLINSLKHANPTSITLRLEKCSQPRLLIIAQGCQPISAQDHSAAEQPSGYGIKIIQKLCSILQIKFRCYTEVDGSEVSELLFPNRN